MGEDEASDAGSGLDGESQASVSSSTGGIEGVLTDSAVQALDGVEVTIEELSRSTTSAQDGSFAFSEVTPGSYTLNFTKEGFLTAERGIDVVANKVATIELVLPHTPEIQPFMQQFKYEGFLECSVSAGAPGVGFLRAAACSIPNDAVQGNATNDRFIFSSPVQANPWQIVTELQWDPGTPAATVMAMSVEPGGLPNDVKTEYGALEAESPLVVNTDRTRIAQSIVNASAVCEGEKSPEQTISAPAESYCNRNVVEKGGEAQVRVFVGNYEEFLGTTFQQPFTMYQTVFYNAPACEDYSIVEDNRCPQLDAPPEADPYEEIVGQNASSANGTDGDAGS